MRLFVPALALALLSLPAFAQLAAAVGPTCAPISENTTFVGVTVDNCTHVSGYVCTEPRYFGGGGGKVPILSNWVCDNSVTFAQLLA